MKTQKKNESKELQLQFLRCFVSNDRATALLILNLCCKCLRKPIGGQTQLARSLEAGKLPRGCPGLFKQLVPISPASKHLGRMRGCWVWDQVLLSARTLIVQGLDSKWMLRVECWRLFRFCNDNCISNCSIWFLPALCWRSKIFLCLFDCLFA